MMMMRKIIPLTVLAAAALTACAGTQRTPQAYRADTQKVLETRNAQIEGCYNALLATDAAAGGTVTVRFVVEKKTGTFAKATIDPAASTAKEPVVLCVLNAVSGLKLEPADGNEGQATFQYELQPAPPPAS
jgi:hypothetical protein